MQTHSIHMSRRNGTIWPNPNFTTAQQTHSETAAHVCLHADLKGVALAARALHHALVDLHIHAAAQVDRHAGCVYVCVCWAALFACYGWARERAQGGAARCAAAQPKDCAKQQEAGRTTQHSCKLGLSKESPKRTQYRCAPERRGDFQ